jgi:hypothetical protein
MRSQKGSRRITVNDVDYRWRATGDDGYISLSIWPLNNVGPYIQGNFGYHQTWSPNGDGSYSSLGDQIVITNRIIRRIVEYAISAHRYTPLLKGKTLNLKVLDNVIKWDDAVRASKHPTN